MLAFLGVAGLFLTLSADFVAVAQVLIYAGAVSILMVFAVMLTPLADRDNANSLYVVPGVLVGIAFAAGILLTVILAHVIRVRGGRRPLELERRRRPGRGPLPDHSRRHR